MFVGLGQISAKFIYIRGELIIMGRKSGRKAINKLVKKILDYNQQQGDNASYIGCCEFGMETYANIKPATVWMYLIAAFLILIGFIGGFIVTILGILFALFSHVMINGTKKKAGIILYNEDYIKILRNSGKEAYTLSLEGLTNMDSTYSKYIYSGQEGTVQVKSGGGKGFAAFLDYLHERHPEMTKKFIDNKLVYNCYMSDKNNMYI